MRANPRVCLEVDEIRDFDEWVSVVVVGSYEELDGRPGCEEARREAARLLRRNAEWASPSLASALIHDRRDPPSGIVYRIRVEAMTGRRASAALWGISGSFPSRA